MSNVRGYAESYKSAEIVLIGYVPVKIVKNIIQTLGATAVQYSTGHLNVQQAKTNLQPETIQLQCSFLGQDRYFQKAYLEAIHKAGKPFTLVTGLTWKARVVIEALAFYQNSSRKTLTGGPVVDFLIRLVEVDVDKVKTADAVLKAAGMGWMLARHVDKGSGNMMITTPPNIDVTESSIEETTRADDELSSETWTAAQTTAANNLNNKYDKIPINPNGVFPQVVKFTYPPSDTHADEFNDISPIPPDYDGYVFPDYKESQLGEVALRFIPKPIRSVIDAGAAQAGIIDKTYSITMEAFIDGELVTKRKLVEGIVYKVGQYDVIFNEIYIYEGNVNPINGTGGEFGSKFDGGIRLRNE